MTDRDTVFKLLIAGLTGLVSWLFFQYFYISHLEAREQMQLFLLTPDYFVSYLNEPGWLASYLGDFLTQFFYYRYGGTLLLTGLLLVEWWLAGWALRRMVDRPHIELYALFLWLAEMFVQMSGYGSLAQPVSFILTFSVLLLYLQLGYKVAFCAGFMLVPILYVSAGPAFCIFAVSVWAAEYARGQRNWFYWLFLLLWTLVFPWGLHFLYPFSEGQNWPDSLITADNQPVAVWLATVILLMLVPRTKLYVSWKEQGGIGVLVLLGFLIGLNSRADFRREDLLTVDRAVCEKNWEKVLSLSQTQLAASPVRDYYIFLSLLNQDLLPEKVFQYDLSPDNMFPLFFDQGELPAHSAGELYYSLQDYNLAREMTGNEVSGNRCGTNIRSLLRLAEISRALADTASMKKYIRILDKTLFYSFPADSVKSPDPVQPLHAPAYRNMADPLASLEQLLSVYPANKRALDYLLCYYLQKRDLSSFGRIYERWGKAVYRDRKLPLLYGEAQVLYGRTARTDGTRRTKRKKQTADPLEKELVEFQKLQKQEDWAALRERFGHSYWAYYYQIAEL